ncbi:MAG: hypothetical protein ABSC05_20685 [Candidatus Solibacter sp.]|jgi:hypothetical protein
MKARKALKRLHRIETLLGTVIDQYEAGTREIHDLLDAAKSSVASATEALAASPARKPPGKAGQPRASRISDAARKRLSVAAKKRWADARRKGMSSLAKPSHKVA